MSALCATALQGHILAPRRVACPQAAAYRRSLCVLRGGVRAPRPTDEHGELFVGAASRSDASALGGAPRNDRDGFPDKLTGVPKGTPVFYRKYHKGKHGEPVPRRQLVLRRGNLPFLEGKLPHKAACGFYFLA